MFDRGSENVHVLCVFENAENAARAAREFGVELPEDGSTVVFSAGFSSLAFSPNPHGLWELSSDHVPCEATYSLFRNNSESTIAVDLYEHITTVSRILPGTCCKAKSRCEAFISIEALRA